MKWWANGLWEGRCYPVETLKAIARFCQKHSLHLISDEVYASCVFETDDPDAVPFTSILSLDLVGLIDPNLVHVLYGFSKVGIKQNNQHPQT
jgi:aspartate/methionine/tyrosine aminotransferase